MKRDWRTLRGIRKGSPPYTHTYANTGKHKHRNIWYIWKNHLKGWLVQKDSTFPHMYHLLHRCGKSRRISDNIWTSTSTRWNRNRNLLRCGARTNERYPSSSRWGGGWRGGCYHHPSETPRSWRVQPMAKFNSDWLGGFHTNTQTLETSYDISWYICQKVLVLGTQLELSALKKKALWWWRMNMFVLENLTCQQGFTSACSGWFLTLKGPQSCLSQYSRLLDCEHVTLVWANHWALISWLRGTRFSLLTKLWAQY